MPSKLIVVFSLMLGSSLFSMNNEDVEKLVSSLTDLNKSIEKEALELEEKKLAPPAVVILLALVESVAPVTNIIKDETVKAACSVATLLEHRNKEEVYEMLLPLTSLIAPFGDVLSFACFFGLKELAMYALEKVADDDAIELRLNEFKTLLRGHGEERALTILLEKHYYHLNNHEKFFE